MYHDHAPEAFPTGDRAVYHPAWWVPGGHLRTLWGKIVRRDAAPPMRFERWDTPDGDFLDLCRLDAPAGRPRLLILHGLEGSPRSHYARGLVREAAQRGWAADILIFRSCGPIPNRALRFYHSGETTDLEFVVNALVRSDPGRPLAIAGVSLGGNVLLKWLGERAEDLPAQLTGAATVSVPYDLARGARRIDQGFSRVYQAHFLRSLKRKAHAKRRAFRDYLDGRAIDAARSLWAFDDAVTAPVHGFRDAADYYAQSSAIGWLPRIRLPTLLLSAEDDPFLPPEVLDDVRAIADRNPSLRPEFVTRGGHVGFISGRVPWRPLYYAEWRVVDFLANRQRTA